MRINRAACLALALLGLCATTSFADMGGLGPSSKIGGIATGTTLMGSRATAVLRTGGIAPVKAMDAGLVGPSTDKYIATVGNPIFHGPPQFLSTAPIGGIGHSVIRNGGLSVRSIDLLPRGEGVLPR